MYSLLFNGKWVVFSGFACYQPSSEKRTYISFLIQDKRINVEYKVNYLNFHQFMFLKKGFICKIQESGVSGLMSKTHMKIMLKWMRGRKMLKLFPNQVGSTKKFLLCTLPEDAEVTQFRESSAVRLQHRKPSIKRKKQKK